ncbi:hypothetical protein L1887_44546 [Cichorium endivia]|nr:hypothetical protein L1887_44546 [Cichorium endivia]
MRVDVWRLRRWVDRSLSLWRGSTDSWVGGGGTTPMRHSEASRCLHVMMPAAVRRSKQKGRCFRDNVAVEAAQERWRYSDALVGNKRVDLPLCEM